MFVNGYYILWISVTIGYVIATPMFYKRNKYDKYEADLIPVSSTVIPLAVYQVSSSGVIRPAPSISEEYKMAYMKLINKKVHKDDDDDDPDTLITLRKKYHHLHQEKKKVKSTGDEAVIVATPNENARIKI